MASKTWITVLTILHMNPRSTTDCHPISTYNNPNLSANQPTDIMILVSQCGALNSATLPSYCFVSFQHAHIDGFTVLNVIPNPLSHKNINAFAKAWSYVCFEADLWYGSYDFLIFAE